MCHQGYSDFAEPLSRHSYGSPPIWYRNNITMYLLYWKQERDKITIIVILHCVFYIYVQSHLCSALWRGPFTTHIRLLYPVMHAFTRASDTCSHAIDSMYLVFVLHLFCAFAILRSGSPLPMFMVSSYGLICGRYSCLYTLRRIHIYYHIFNANIGAQLETVISGYIKYIQNIYPIYTPNNAIICFS